MRERICRTVVLLAALLLAVLCPAAYGQALDVRTVEERADGLTLEVTATWQVPLAAVLDSAGPARNPVLAAGLGAQAARSVMLPARALPQVTATAADYDELRLDAPLSDTLAALLAGPAVGARGLGLERRRPAATVYARMLTYDAATQTLRRYRRIVMDVRFGARTGGDARTAALGRADSPHLAVSRSALADGLVFRIPITAEGLYRIDRNALAGLLRAAGASIDDVTPDRVKLYGNGGAPLPALAGAPRPADLTENPVLVTADGSGFGDLVFYAAGPSGWRYVGNAWQHYVNPFTTENVYFLKVDVTGSAAGRRVGEVPYPDLADAAVRTQVPGRAFVDPDEMMWSSDKGSGLTWLSRQISSGRSLDVLNGTLPGLAPGAVQIRARVAAKANPAVPIRFSLNGAAIGQITPSAIGSYEEAPVATAAEGTLNGTVGGTAMQLTMTVESRPSDPQGALDWARIFYTQDLRATNDVLRFVTPVEGGRFTYALSGFTAEPQVWDVTDPGAIRRLGVRSAGGAYQVQLETAAGAPRELIAFAPAAVTAVASAARVPNQNLHGIESYPAFVIVAPDTFRTEAVALAERRRAQGLATEVVSIAQIFNEFGGGLPDMRALRDYLKFLYDRAPSDELMPRYALLFGDGHFDYRGISQPALRNWIPPFETDESFDPLRSYTSDDYFGLLDDDEGVWPYLGDSSPSSERIDIGVGRLTIQTPADAAAVLAKMQRYEDPATYGAWRSRYLFMADDAYNGTSGILESTPDLHTQNADVVARDVERINPAVNIEKVYGISYPRTYANGWRQPLMRADVLNALQNGVLVFNYSGHGRDDILTQEQVFTQQDAENMDNLDRLPVFVTATCSFGRWDMGNGQSGAEALLLNPRGGAVALMTTVRTVLTSISTADYNVGLNRALNTEMLRRDASGQPRRLGDIMRDTKNTQAGAQGNNRKFNLLADPTLRLGLPTGSVAVEAVNGVRLDTALAPLRALDRVTVSGSVRTADGQPDAAFNGRVAVTVFDAERRVPVEQGSIGSYRVREDLIWRGEVDATAGRYEATFVVPKDISFTDRTGRIAAYASSEAGEAMGVTERVLVGGTAANPIADAEGPRIDLFLNDTTATFASGALTTPTPRLFVRLDDRSGINTVGAGVGHEMLLVVDGDEANAINIGPFYRSDANSYQRGWVEYDLLAYARRQDGQATRLSPGTHTLQVRAWDVANNASSANLAFEVTATEDLVLRNVYNYPNPTAGATRFVFEHNQPAGTPARVQIRIYTLAGRPVRTIDADEALPGGILPGGLVQVPWDGRDEDFDALGTGIYLYRVRVEAERSDGLRQVSEHIEKLAVIR